MIVLLCAKPFGCRAERKSGAGGEAGGDSFGVPDHFSFRFALLCVPVWSNRTASIGRFCPVSSVCVAACGMCVGVPVVPHAALALGRATRGGCGKGKPAGVGGMGQMTGARGCIRVDIGGLSVLARRCLSVTACRSFFFPFFP